MYILGNIKVVCNSKENTESGNHIINRTNAPEIDSKNIAPVHNVDVVNNNESHKIGKKQLKKNNMKEKNVDKTDNNKKINNIPLSDDSSEESTDNEKKQDTEIIFIQDLGFNVKIVCPGTEGFEIQVCFIQYNVVIF